MVSDIELLQDSLTVARSNRVPIQSGPQDNVLLVWPVVAGLIAVIYGLLVDIRFVPAEKAFLEGVLLVQTVVLTVVVALVAVLAQRSSAEILLLTRIRRNRMRVILSEFSLGIALGTAGVMVVLAQVSAPAKVGRAVTILVSILLFVSVALLVVSLFVLLRRISSERLVEALIDALREYLEDKDRFERVIAEIDAYGSRLVDDSDLVAFRQLARGLADLQSHCDLMTSETPSGTVDSFLGASGALASLQLRLMTHGQRRSLFAQTIVRAFNRQSIAMHNRMEEVLRRVTNSAELDRDLIVEVLRVGSECPHPRSREFWAESLTILLSPSQLSIWDDRFIQPLLDQVAAQRVTGTDLRRIVDSVVGLKSVTPERVKMFVDRIEAVPQSSMRTKAYGALQEQVGRLWPRVLRGRIEAQAAADRLGDLSSLIRETKQLSDKIGASFERSFMSVSRELQLIDGDARALYALVVLSRVGSQSISREAQAIVEQQLCSGLESGDERLLARAILEQYTQAAGSAGRVAACLHEHTKLTRLAGLSAAQHVRWACSALSRGPEDIGARSLDYVAQYGLVEQSRSRTGERLDALFGELLESSLQSLAARFGRREPATLRVQRASFEVLSATLVLAMRNLRTNDAMTDGRRTQICAALEAIATSLDDGPEATLGALTPRARELVLLDCDEDDGQTPQSHASTQDLVRRVAAGYERATGRP
jgi:hypothetical protein